jgi:GNAT superfamily N-acetyltransferase
VQITRAGIERVDELEALWKALQDHHAEVMPNAGGLAPRELEQTWEMRRTKYNSLLSEPEAFVLIAEDGDRVLGYAMVGISDGSIGYVTGPRVGEVETLSVLPDARGRGVGESLMNAVDHHLTAIGLRGSVFPWSRATMVRCASINGEGLCPLPCRSSGASKSPSPPSPGCCSVAAGALSPASAECRTGRESAADRLRFENPVLRTSAIVGVSARAGADPPDRSVK